VSRDSYPRPLRLSWRRMRQLELFRKPVAQKVPGQSEVRVERWSHRCRGSSQQYVVERLHVRSKEDDVRSQLTSRSPASSAVEPALRRCIGEARADLIHTTVREPWHVFATAMSVPAAAIVTLVFCVA
jgi:hypothetical protein